MVRQSGTTGAFVTRIFFGNALLAWILEYGYNRPNNIASRKSRNFIFSVSILVSLLTNDMVPPSFRGVLRSFLVSDFPVRRLGHIRHCFLYVYLLKVPYACSDLDIVQYRKSLNMYRAGMAYAACRVWGRDRKCIRYSSSVFFLNKRGTPNQFNVNQVSRYSFARLHTVC